MKRKKVYEKVDEPCGDISLDVAGDAPWEQKFAGKEYDPQVECPTAEQAMLRQAIRYLTPKQRRVWELYNYDKLTQDEIGARLGITHQAVGKHLKAIEKRVAKWCASNMGAYKLIKQEMEK